ncbi:hypothetical protein [Glacieibacterium frigidum]|uniref:Uncharacterized protein n=1 Tax=Glacieibacterium frigidum TaxID=2593303 RepID=A0A552UIX3_9SPHN|nr:hypothetical protein [Glacieibacterium frigidum]TRW18173.1 hypothetical protein FMM06_08735 [Glacieibacterium frigidum]
MDRETSLLIFAVALVLTVSAMLGDRARRRAPLAAHALVPWHALLFVGLTGMIFMGVHLLAMG